jgi:predicted RND superfamily exporter protein
VLWIAFLLAIAGFVAAENIDVDSDFSQLAPSSGQSTLEQATGSSGQVSVLVHGADLADPRAIAWMSGYERRVLARHGYSDRRPCRDAQLCPGLSITNLFTSGPPRTRRQAEAVFRSLPRYFSQNVITKDRRTANMAFGLGSMSAGDRKKVIDDMRDQLDPPAGVTAALAGLPVTAAQTRSSLETSQWSLALAALVAIFLVLLVAYRSAEEALVPLTPVAIAPFWAAPALLLLQVPLNPLSIGLWALVMALVAGFSVLLAALYRAERATEQDRRAAVAASYRRSRRVSLSCAGAVLVGFVVLIFSGVDVLADLGVAALLDLAFALAGTMLVLPAALVLAEEGVRFPRTRAEASAATRSAVARARLGLAGAGRAVRAAPGHVRRAAPAARRRLRASAPFRK